VSSGSVQQVRATHPAPFTLCRRFEGFDWLDAEMDTTEVTLRCGLNRLVVSRKVKFTELFPFRSL